jgi:hypothetical protein
MFNKNSLRELLKNKKYIGVHTYKGKEIDLNEITHKIPRLVSDEIFYEVAKILENNRKAPAKAKAKIEYLLTHKLYCGHCKEMMTGFSGTGRNDMVYRYYTCNGVKKGICKRKMVGKDYVEDIVIAECRKLLTDKNIAKIAKEVVAVCEAEKDTANLRRLKNDLSENERKHKNLMDAIMECDIESLRKSMFSKAPELEQERIRIENDLLLTEIEAGNKQQEFCLLPAVRKCYNYDKSKSLYYQWVAGLSLFILTLLPLKSGLFLLGKHLTLCLRQKLLLRNSNGRRERISAMS